MDIEINNNKHPANFKNGKYYYSFIPTKAKEQIKLYHMGCVGDTRLNRIQLEQGTEPSSFVIPKEKTNTLSGIFKNLRDLDVMMKDPSSDLWSRIKKNTRGTIEEYHNSTVRNEIVRTAEGIVERQTKVINTSVDNKINVAKNELNSNLASRVTTLTTETKRYADGISETLSRRVDGVVSDVGSISRTVDGMNTTFLKKNNDLSKTISEVNQKADSISSRITSVNNDLSRTVSSVDQRVDRVGASVSTLEGNVLKKNEITISNDGITLGSGKRVDGNTISSILTTQPDSIKAITEKMIITPPNENLVKLEYRGSFDFKSRDLYLNKISDSNKAGDEYYFEVEASQVAGSSNTYKDLKAMVHVKYKDDTHDWYTSDLYLATGYGVKNCVASVKIPDKQKEIAFIEPMIHQPAWNDFTTYKIDKLKVYKKKSAELIVDGTIEGKHIKSSSIETGHLKTGSVTANIIASDAIESKHLKVSDAMIDKLVGNKAFVSKLWAKEAFINNLESVKIKSTQIDAFSLTGAIISGGILRGETKIQIGKHGYMIPEGNGMRFCLPRVDNANDGVGMQLLGNYGRLGSSVYGLYLYVDPAFDTKEVKTTDSYLMTVLGYIKTRGVNNLQFINYDDDSTAIGIWDKDVTLKFDRTDNDIYYSWKSRYSLWSIVKRHYNTTSDIRLKKDIQDCTYNALDLIDSFKFKSFNWNYHEEFGQKPYTEIGLIAQDVEKISENFVSMAGEYKTLNQFNLLTYSLKAIQELSTENKELKQRILKLEEIVNG